MAPFVLRMILACSILACLWCLTPACSGGGGGLGDEVSEAARDVARDVVRGTADAVDDRITTAADENRDDLPSDLRDLLTQARR